MAQDPDCTFDEAIGELADELVRSGASLSRIAAPGGRGAGGTPCTGERAGVALHRLLCDVLRRALTGHTATELLDTAGVVSCATDAIDRELVAVDRSAGRT